MTSQMTAMMLNSYGSDAIFEAEQLSKPTVGAAQVLVRIAASSVNTVDTMIRRSGEDLSPLSPPLPALLGMDFAGTVEAVGREVKGFAPGDEVYGCAGGLGDLPGTLAEYIAADARLIAKKPKSLTLREAAALPLVGITAFEGLQRAGAKNGQKILVHGGTGGVGHVATQLAKHYGAKVFATVSNEADASIVNSYGATAIQYKREPVREYVAKHTNGAGFDIVFDSVGGANMANSFDAAALNGQVASTVSLVEIDLTTAHYKGLSLHVVFMLIPMLHDLGRDVHGNILAKLADIVDKGGLVPLIDPRRFELSQLNDAYEHLVSGRATGKIVIDHT